MRGQMPDTSRGFSPAAAAQYIQLVQQQKKVIDTLKEENQAFSNRNGELTQHVLRLEGYIKATGPRRLRNFISGG